MIIGLLIPIILASVFIIYNLWISKYYNKYIIEGLKSCGLTKDNTISNNTKKVGKLSIKVSSLSKQLNKMMNSLNKVKNTNNINDNKLKIIENEIIKTQKEIDKADE